MGNRAAERETSSHPPMNMSYASSRDLSLLGKRFRQRSSGPERNDILSDAVEPDSTEEEITEPGPSGTFAVIGDEEGPLGGMELVQAIAEAAWERRAIDVQAMKVNELVGYTDYFIVCSGTSDRQVNAIAQSIEVSLKKNYKTRTNGSEGRDSGRWILLDYVDVIVHVLYQPVREYYEFEKLWSDAPSVTLEEPEWLQNEGLNKWDLE